MDAHEWIDYLGSYGEIDYDMQVQWGLPRTHTYLYIPVYLPVYLSGWLLFGLAKTSDVHLFNTHLLHLLINLLRHATYNTDACLAVGPVISSS